MSKKYYLVEESVIDESVIKVINAKNLIDSGISITVACKRCDISRSTFYKYKDLIYQPENDSTRRMVLSLKLVDETGVLSNVLNFVAKCGGNVLSIHQEMPIHNIAFVMLTIDIVKLEKTIANFVGEIKDLSKVVEVILTAVE